jgi:hypothetical protein
MVAAGIAIALMGAWTPGLAQTRKPAPAASAPKAPAPTAKGKTAPAAKGKAAEMEEDDLVEDEGDAAIAAGVGDSEEGPNVNIRRPQNRVTAPIDLSKPVTDAQGGPPVDFALTARLAPDVAPLGGGVIWRVFGEREGPDGRLPLLSQAEGGAISLKLSPGSYLVHAAYGRAGATKRIVVSAGGGKDDFVLNAGGMRLNALVGKDTPIANNLLTFDIYIDDAEEGERTLVVSRVPPKRIIRLHAGTYYVVSHYGDSNAMVRAAIKVEAGKLTDATLFHQAARVTLKLVSERGGEALANTAWSVQKPGGEAVVESVGAYQQAVLAAGQYVAVAKHDGKTYRSTFVVENDLNRDVEVIAK